MGGEGDRLIGGGLLDIARQGEGFLELGPDLDPAADLLGEDALAVGALQSVDLDPQLLLHGRAARVADPDRDGGRLRPGGGDRRARLPRRSWAAVGGDGDGQFLAQRGHQDESGGVVSRGDFARPGAAGAAGRRLALGARMALDRARRPDRVSAPCRKSLRTACQNRVVVRGVLRIASWADRERIGGLAELAQLFICENPEAPRRKHSPLASYIRLRCKCLRRRLAFGRSSGASRWFRTLGERWRS